MKRTAEASTYIKAPRPLVYSVLKAYELYRAWVPDIIESRVFAREGDVAVAQFISPHAGYEKLVLEIVESPEVSLIFGQVDHFRRGLAGRFELAEVDGGEAVVVKAMVEFRAGILSLRSRQEARRVLERMLDSLAERSLRLAWGTEADQSKKLLLELVREKDAVRVRFDDQEFELLPRESGAGQ